MYALHRGAQLVSKLPRQLLTVDFIRYVLCADLLAPFAGRVQHVYFALDPEPVTAGKVSGIVAVFRLDKPA